MSISVDILTGTKVLDQPTPLLFANAYCLIMRFKNFGFVAAYSMIRKIEQFTNFFPP